MSTETFFQPGRHCDSVRYADRFSSLIDGPDYFRVLRATITHARCAVSALGDFLHEVVATRKTAVHLNSRVGFPNALRVRARVIAGLQDGMENIQ
jgi:phospholipase D1/2